MPAGLPCGMPGIGEEIDGAIQQAPQPGRQSSASEDGVGRVLLGIAFTFRYRKANAE